VGKTYKKWICQICWDIFASLVKLEKHYANHHERFKTCDICLLPVERGKGSDGRLRMVAHKNAEHALERQAMRDKKRKGLSKLSRKDKVICDFCGKRVCYGSLKNHTEVCRNAKSYEFSGQQIYSYEPEVEMPVNSEDPRQCPVPGCSFRDEGKTDCLLRMKRHYKSRHWRGACPYCGIVLAWMPLKQHVTEKHTLDKRWRCDKLINGKECGERFTNREKLMMHVDAVHICKPIHVCDVCGKAFVVKRNMQNHRSEAHFRNRKHPCPKCGVIFRSKTLVAPHVKQHHPEIYESYRLTLNDRKQ